MPKVLMMRSATNHHFALARAARHSAHPFQTSDQTRRSMKRIAPIMPNAPLENGVAKCAERF